MAFGSTPTDSSGIPAGSVYVPGVGFKVLRGGNTNTDTSTNDSAAVATSPEDGAKATYSAAIAGQIPVTTAGDCFVLTGSSTTKIVRLTRVQVTGTATTAITLDVTLVRRSTADSAGTSTTPTIVKHDSNNPTPTASVKAYTVAPTAGTLVGMICSEKLLLAVSAATGGESQVEWIFGERPVQCPVLRGALESFAVTISAIPSGGSMDISMEFTEE